MATAMKSDLESMLGYYFPGVEVVTEAKEGVNSSYTILLYCTVLTEEGIKIELSKVVTMETSSLRKVINVNNYGEGLAILNSSV